ncbi:hypothetical protein HID58_036556 [Brassica napus]|uniref:F-box domain-containing protein n=1 Tax=Brassica napus TaxID=3708 RepID=A0ABQ8C827_BRANA|nr:hypothetical protein HID58_036556 [Brassica napus]
MLVSFRDAQTSGLSKRWENVWLSVPCLDFDLHSSVVPYHDNQMLFTFLDKLLNFSPELSLLKVKVKCRDMMIDGFMELLGTVIRQHLDGESSTDYIDDYTNSVTLPCVEFMPMNIYTSKTLVCLKLTSSGLRDPGVVFMPCLKFMHLEQVKRRVHLAKLISGCPVLEELTLLRDPEDRYKALLVRTRSLKRFLKCTLKIDAPGLEHLSLGDDQICSIVVKNLTCLLVVKLDVKFRVLVNTWNVSKINVIRDFLNGISCARHMIVSAKTVQALARYSQLGMIPKFNNLSRLQAVFRSKLLQVLPAFLECCPNLKHLILKVVHSEEMEEGLELTDVPQCVSSTLECVEIKDKFEWEEGKMKVASYFLENSAVLKKLILSPTAYDPRYVVESEIYDKVNKLTKRSTRCEVIIRAHGGGFRLVMPGCDMISELPDSLLTQILSYLPTGDSVQTGILSKRWKNLWLSVPALDLNCFLIAYEDDEEVLFTFVERFLEFSPESSLLKVKVRCRPLMIDGFMDRVGTMISRGTQHLDVVSRNCYFEERGMYYACVEFMPMNLYTSKTLVYLKLSSSGLMDPEVKWRVHLEKVLSGCPVLEELTLARDPDDDYALRNDEFGVMRVRSQSLKRFSVLPLREVRDYHSIVKCTLEIDAPGLEYMSLGEDQFDSIVVKNLTSLIMVNLDIKFVINLNGFFDPWDASKRNEIRGFLNGISSALDLYSKGGMIPKFNNLSRLEAVFPSALLQFLPAFLECCPNLKHLVLKVVHSEEMNEGLELTDVPRCVSTTLECVEIKDKFEWEEEKMKVASYFLENSAVLKKFILSPTAYNQNIYEKVNKLAKRSTVCQIIHE